MHISRHIPSIRYCNSRVVKFTKFGVFLAEFGSLSVAKGVVGGMNLVHDLAINHLDNVIYVADRENGQVMWVKTVI